MRQIIQFIVLLILWLLLTWSLQPAEVIAGAVISIIVIALMGNLFIEKAVKILNPVRLFWGIIYVPYLLWYIIVANFDVAYRVINPSLPIRPGIVKIKTGLKTEMGKTFLANSITLTPGTMTVDVVDDELYIHWINVKADNNPAEQAELIAGKFEKMLRRIFE